MLPNFQCCKKCYYILKCRCYLHTFSIIDKLQFLIHVICSSLFYFRCNQTSIFRTYLELRKFRDIKKFMTSNSMIEIVMAFLNTLHHNWNVFMNSIWPAICSSAHLSVCIFARALTRITIVRFSLIVCMLLAIIMAFSVLKMKCVVFPFHLQGHSRKFRYITIYKENLFAVILMIVHYLTYWYLLL